MSQASPQPPIRRADPSLQQRTSKDSLRPFGLPRWAGLLLYVFFWVLLIIGVLQSLAMIAMSVTLLQITPERFRGRIMGVRMLAVYGLPLGLLAAGGLVELSGFTTTVWLYALLGILCTGAITWRWRRDIWR